MEKLQCPLEMIQFSNKVLILWKLFQSDLEKTIWKIGELPNKNFQQFCEKAYSGSSLSQNALDKILYAISKRLIRR